MFLEEFTFQGGWLGIAIGCLIVGLIAGFFIAAILTVIEVVSIFQELMIY